MLIVIQFFRHAIKGIGQLAKLIFTVKMYSLAVVLISDGFNALCKRRYRGSDK